MSAPKGHWARLGDPALTPAAELREVYPDKLAAYYRLCQRQDLPAELVARMLTSTVRDSCTVTQSSKGMHLLNLRFLDEEQLFTLATALAEHEWNDRVVEQVVVHPRATRQLLARLCWAADPVDRDRHLRVVLERSGDPYVRRTLAFTDTLCRSPRASRLTDASVAKLARTVYLLGPDAATFVIKALPTWRATWAELWTAARGVAAAQPAS